MHLVPGIPDRADQLAGNIAAWTGHKVADQARGLDGVRIVIDRKRPLGAGALRCSGTVAIGKNRPGHA